MQLIFRRVAVRSGAAVLFSLHYVLQIKKDEVFGKIVLNKFALFKWPPVYLCIIKT